MVSLNKRFLLTHNLPLPSEGGWGEGLTFKRWSDRYFLIPGIRGVISVFVCIVSCVVQASRSIGSDAHLFRAMVPARRDPVTFVK